MLIVPHSPATGYQEDLLVELHLLQHLLMGSKGVLVGSLKAFSSQVEQVWSAQQSGDIS